MTGLTTKQIKSFQKEILDWFEKNKRDLPWRDVPVTHNMRSGASLNDVPVTTHGRLGTSLRDPYPILVSEVMLQQTQVQRVIPKFEAWMREFPTVERLAKASTRDVLLLWSGLGYNRRALYLKKAAEQLLANSKWHMANGKNPGSRVKPGMTVKWPETEEELQKLPGIGEYTARAILCFAFNQQIAVVDTNVRKVILTRFKIQDLRFKREKMLKQVQHDKIIQEIADKLLPKGKAYEWNQALMDYSSAMLKKEKIPIPKQSHFKTSNRFYRGQVIRLLLEKDKQTIRSLFVQIQNNGITQEKFEEILKGMEKDRLLVSQKHTYSLPL